MDAPTASPSRLSQKKLAAILPSGVAAVLLAGAVALGVNTIVSARRPDSVLPPNPVLPPLADATTAINRQKEIAGTYATGSASGDRIIVIHADGRVDFSELGAKDVVNSDSELFQLRQRDKKFALVTAHRGVIDVVDIDNVSYWRDVYRRK